MTTRRRLMIFAKGPVPGRVKTRLAGRWGGYGACRVYKQLLGRTAQVAFAVPDCSREIRFAGSHPYLRALARRYRMGLRPQSPGDLGQRMAGALREASGAGELGVIVGGDCATLAPEMIDRAFRELESGADLVLGPALDGGYLLIGARRSPAALMRGVEWGSERVLAQTLRRARRLKLSVALLEPLMDVDRPADVKHLRRAGRLSAW